MRYSILINSIVYTRIGCTKQVAFISLASIQPNRASYVVKIVDSKTVLLFKRAISGARDSSSAVMDSVGSDTSVASVRVCVPSTEKTIATAEFDNIVICDNDYDGGAGGGGSSGGTSGANPGGCGSACSGGGGGDCFVPNSVCEAEVPILTIATTAGSTVNDATQPNTNTTQTATSTSVQSVNTATTSSTSTTLLTISTQTVDVATNDVAVSAVSNMNTTGTNTDNCDTSTSVSNHAVITIDSAISTMISTLTNTTNEELLARSIDPVTFRALANAMNDMCKRKR